MKEWMYLYEMELGEEYVFDAIRTGKTSKQWIVTRVPGGWIMRESNIPNAAYCFVSYDNEFQR